MRLVIINKEIIIKVLSLRVLIFLLSLGILFLMNQFIVKLFVK